MEYYGIEDKAKEMMKSEWKKIVKTKIREKEEERMRKECQEKHKYRVVLQGKYEMKQYIKDLSITKAKDVLAARLFMIKIPGNYKKREDMGPCWLCGEGNEDMEHLYQCKKTEEIRKQWNTTACDLISTNTGKLVRTSQFLNHVESIMEPKWTLMKLNEQDEEKL